MADDMKISLLENSLNRPLNRLLLNKSLPEDDYDKWISKVKRVAGRLENTPEYRPKGCSGIKTWYLPLKTSQGGFAPKTSSRASHPELDADGDTKMGDVTSAKIAQAGISALSRNLPKQSNRKPPAKWRSMNEFKRLSGEGRCVRSSLAHFKSGENTNPQIQAINDDRGIEEGSVELFSGGRITPEHSRTQGHKECSKEQVKRALSKMNGSPFPINCQVDVRAAFHKLRVRERDEEKTTFRTRFGSSEWLVAPFGLQGAPAAFQRYVNETLGDYLDVFCTAYLDDILIYTAGDLKDHWHKVHAVFERLSKAGLKLDPNKCEFAVKETKYLGFVISLSEGIKVDQQKVEATKSWAPPTSVKGMRSFLGLANFYRDFIPNFSEIAQPLLNLTKKDHAFFLA
ncbi:hypothetical protein K3495_g11774 [Podosphaera aphanis]|nr:hypothetical protein K3495_g11774 [Podosphaera aphanis]